MADPVLQVKNLNVSYEINRRWVSAVRDFHLQINAGQVYGVVGESGSGKSTAAKAIIRYLAANGRIEPGSSIWLAGDELTSMPLHALRSIWGARVNLVPQNPGAALNPAMRVGDQVAEIIRLHGTASRTEAQQQAVEALRRVNLPDPESTVRRYPHELSGGQQQRVLIAMALITSPRLLILDEPTTALDVTTEATILDLVHDLIHAEGAGALFVTHNLGVVAQFCDRVSVLYAGEIVEDAATQDLYDHPLHPYTMGLLNSVVHPGQTKRDRALSVIEGQPPALTDRPEGCAFAARCPLAVEICQTRPPLAPAGDGRLVRCHRWQDVAEGAAALSDTKAQDAAVDDNLAESREGLLQARDLSKHYAIPRTLRDVFSGSTPKPVHAVEKVSLHVLRGRTYGLVGESGSGKTTLARLIIGLEQSTSGTLDLLGIDINRGVRQRPSEVLSTLQMVFQNPQNSLNPYLTVGQAIRRPLIKLRGLSRPEADREVERLLRDVNLNVDYAQRHPTELSGGEKQRVAIARAFASDPALVLCDEPVSSLDVSVQAAVLNLLARLQEERGTAYLFISHDLAVVGYLADYVAVMYLGELFEVGAAKELFNPPLHPYTEALVSAIPAPDPHRRALRVRLSDDIPSPREKPSGCAFHTRCPRKLGPICEQEAPPWHSDENDHFIRCHIPLDELAVLQGQALMGKEE